MRFVAWRGLSKKYRKAVKGHSPWKPDVEDPQPVGIADVGVADIPKSLKSTIQREGIGAAGFIPLVSTGRLIGKFMAYYNAPHRFTDNELKLATTIARQLVQAIQHKHDADALRASEAQMRATVEQATAGVVRYDMRGRFVFVNQTFCQMLGYPESELIGKSIAEVPHRDDVKENMHSFRRMVQEGKSFEMEKRYIRKDGSILWADVSASAVRGPDSKIESGVAVVVDITARKKAEAALHSSKKLLEQRVRERTRELHLANKELQAEIGRRKGLEGKILEVSDREQQRIGQELHDGLCQHLTAVAFMARSTALRLKDHRVVDAKDIEKIAELVNAAATDTRNLSRALHRMDVDAPGFVTALEDLVDREIWKTPCRLEIKPSFRIEDDIAAAQLYRIAREAVINASKHSQAREIVVELERSLKVMILRVTDNGVGIPDKPNLNQGLGFHIMKYRARLIGARLEIDSPKQGGTRVACYAPDAPLQSRKKENGQPGQFAAKIAKALAVLI
jgi:PAS domain S-box-containing protein